MRSSRPVPVPGPEKGILPVSTNLTPARSGAAVGEAVPGYVLTAARSGCFSFLGEAGSADPVLSATRPAFTGQAGKSGR